MKVLIIEDNGDLLENIQTYLEREGYICETANHYETAFDKIYAHSYDIVLIDIMLPDGDGLQLLSELKTIDKDTGTIIISAKNALDDKVKGLDLGADDYLTKPFHLSELHARMRAVNRRKHLGGEEELKVGNIRINSHTREVHVHGEEVDLTPKEFDLLEYFVANQNHVLSKQTIAEHLWGDYVDHLENLDFVYQHIKNLRKKLVQAGGEDFLETVYGIGYKFNPQTPQS